jgi:hypothetical protein
MKGEERQRPESRLSPTAGGRDNTDVCEAKTLTLPSLNLVGARRYPRGPLGDPEAPN